MVQPARFVMWLAISVFAIGAEAQIYKWTDAEGHVHYTQEPPPPGVEGKEMKPPPPPPASAADEEERLETLKETLEERKAQREEAADAARAEEEARRTRQHNCEVARKRLEQAQFPRVSFVEPDGTERRATEEERQREIAEAQAQVNDFCKN
jgi:actin-related protein